MTSCQALWLVVPIFVIAGAIGESTFPRTAMSAQKPKEKPKPKPIFVFSKKGKKK